MQIANAHSIDALASSRPGPPAAVVGASWLSPPKPAAPAASRRQASRASTGRGACPRGGV